MLVLGGPVLRQREPWGWNEMFLVSLGVLLCFAFSNAYFNTIFKF